MADDVSKQIKLSQQLVMTPQLQMAIRMLQTPTAELGAMLDKIVGLEPAEPGDPDLVATVTDQERELAEEDNAPVWNFDLAVRGTGDVVIAGGTARANRHVLPHVRVSATADADQQREAVWFVRALRQRAKTYERFTEALLELRPALATGGTFEPAPVRAIAERLGMHESTMTRVAAGCRIEVAGTIRALSAGKRGIEIV
jgi:hypothetical protein